MTKHGDTRGDHGYGMVHLVVLLWDPAGADPGSPPPLSSTPNSTLSSAPPFSEQLLHQSLAQAACPMFHLGNPTEVTVHP